jgi:hypothetical protein
LEEHTGGKFRSQGVITPPGHLAQGWQGKTWRADGVRDVCHVHVIDNATDSHYYGAGWGERQQGEESTTQN